MGKLLRDFVVAEEMPDDGNGRRYQPPRPAQKPRAEFVVAEEMPGDGEGIGRRAPRRGRAGPLRCRQDVRCGDSHTVLLKETVPPTLHLQVLLPDGDGDGDGGWYWSPRLTQRPREDFGVAGKMPGNR